MKDFVEDKFFSKGHYFIKFYQSLFGIGMWLLVFLPVAITINSIFRKNMGLTFLHRWNHLEGFHMFYDTAMILLISAVLIGFICILLTVRNNYKIKHQFKKKVTYNPTSVDKKLQLLEEVYTARFGPKAEREGLQFYSVQENQNLDSDFVQTLYKKEGVV